MIITDSLAQGLKSDLWRLADTEGDRLWQYFKKNDINRAMGREDSRKAIHHLYEYYRQAHGPLLVDLGRSEAKRPYLWSISLALQSDVPVNEWNEDVIAFFFLGFRLRPIDRKYSHMPVRVGEHAIRRLFQRHSCADNGVPKITAIIPELKYAALFGSWLTMSVATMPETENLRLAAFVPSPEDAFLGCPDADGTKLELRTWISRRQMRPAQLALWAELMELYENREYRLPQPAAILNGDILKPDFYAFSEKLDQALLRHADELDIGRLEL